MMGLERTTRVFIFSKSIDMRWGFERLSYLVREEMSQRIDVGDLFLFLGKNRRRLKGLRFDGSGLMLLTKRMEKNCFMSASDLDGRVEITQVELELLIHGSVIRKYLPEGRRCG